MMNRRESIFGLAAVGSSLAINSNVLLRNGKQNKITHFIGLGDAGCNALEFFHKKGTKANYTVILDQKRSDLSSEINFIEFDSPRHYGWTRGYDLPDTIQSIIVPNEINNIFEEGNNFILLAGLGGYTGTYLTIALTTLLHDGKKDYMTICTSPFEFEGKMRKAIAYKFNTNTNSVLNLKCYDLNMIREKYGNLKINEAFEKGNEEMYSIYKNSI